MVLALTLTGMRVYQVTGGQRSPCRPGPCRAAAWGPPWGHALGTRPGDTASAVLQEAPGALQLLHDFPWAHVGKLAVLVRVRRGRGAPGPTHQEPGGAQPSLSSGRLPGAPSSARPRAWVSGAWRSDAGTDTALHRGRWHQPTFRLPRGERERKWGCADLHRVATTFQAPLSLRSWPPRSHPGPGLALGAEGQGAWGPRGQAGRFAGR